MSSITLSSSAPWSGDAVATTTTNGHSAFVHDDTLLTASLQVPPSLHDIGLGSDLAPALPAHSLDLNHFTQHSLGSAVLSQESTKSGTPDSTPSLMLGEPSMPQQQPPGRDLTIRATPTERSFSSLPTFPGDTLSRTPITIPHDDMSSSSSSVPGTPDIPTSSGARTFAGTFPSPFEFSHFTAGPRHSDPQLTASDTWRNTTTVTPQALPPSQSVVARAPPRPQHGAMPTAFQQQQLLPTAARYDGAVLPQLPPAAYSPYMFPQSHFPGMMGAMGAPAAPFAPRMYSQAGAPGMYGQRAAPEAMASMKQWGMSAVTPQQLQQQQQQQQGFMMSQWPFPPQPGAVPASPVASPVTLSPSQLTGKVLAMSKDQNGCRMLQERLDIGDEGVRTSIFEEAFPAITELMSDPFGNYLFQKLLETASGKQRLRILEAITATCPSSKKSLTSSSVRVPAKRESSHVVEASFNLHGTRSVQKAIECCQGAEESQHLVDALKPHVVRLSTDSNGNHVVQKCLLKLPSSQRAEIAEPLIKQYRRVGSHRHGCCVLQRCLECLEDEQKQGLIDNIVAAGLEFIQDPFANYVVQWVIEKGPRSKSSKVMNMLVGNISHLAQQKFSSNVVEKTLKFGSDAIRKKIVKEFCQTSDLRALLHDHFANYCIQTAIQFSDVSSAKALVETIRPHFPTLSHSSGGRRIAGKIMKKFPELSSLLPSTGPTRHKQTAQSLVRVLSNS